MKKISLENLNLAVDEEYVFNEFKVQFPVEGKAILEIGGAFPSQIVVREKVRQWIAVDPLNNDSSSANDHYRTHKAFASSIPYPDNHFDSAFSSNAFQHIHDLSLTLRETHRVLKNGAVLYAHYGPIWSGPDGSHIENLCYNGKCYNFWDNAFIPPWFHLIYTGDQLCKILSSVIERDFAEVIVGYIEKSNWINRLFFEDYLEIFISSPFAIESIVTESRIDYDYTVPEYTNPLISDFNITQILEKIQKRFGKNKRNILCRDMKVVFKKIG